MFWSKEEYKVFEETKILSIKPKRNELFFSEPIHKNKALVLNGLLTVDNQTESSHLFLLFKEINKNKSETKKKYISI